MSKSISTSLQPSTVFSFNSFNFQVLEFDGELWFIAKEVCDILGLGNSRQALSRLDHDEKNTVISNDGTPGNPEKAIINESGLYSLILGSKKKGAKEFKRWVTHDVIPSIRKTGYYISGQKDLFDVPQIDTPSTVKDRRPLSNLVNTLVSMAPLGWQDVWGLVHNHVGKKAEDMTLGDVQAAMTFVQAKIDLAISGGLLTPFEQALITHFRLLPTVDQARLIVAVADNKLLQEAA